MQDDEAYERAFRSQTRINLESEIYNKCQELSDHIRNLEGEIELKNIKIKSLIEFIETGKTKYNGLTFQKGTNENSFLNTIKL